MFKKVERFSSVLTLFVLFALLLKSTSTTAVEDSTLKELAVPGTKLAFFSSEVQAQSAGANLRVMTYNIWLVTFPTLR